MTDKIESPTPGTPEHEEAMIKIAEGELNNSGSESKKEGEGNEEVTTHEKPEGVPDKFWNAETGVVDYASMQKETEYWRKKSEGTAEPNPEGKPKEEGGEGSEEEDAAEKMLESKGLDMATYSEEFAATGGLSDKSYEALEKAGIPKEMVDDYIAGREAIADSQRTNLLKDVGGDEGYDKMTSWMQGNLSSEEIESYNEQVASKNQATIKNAITNMHSKYTEATGSNGELLSGDGDLSINSGYTTRSDMTAAMNDPRYGKDSNYTKQVEEKVAKTPDSIFTS